MTDFRFDDDSLVALLGSALAGGDDPVPEAALGAALAARDVHHIEGEIASLVEESERELLAVRAAPGATISLLTFVSSSSRIEIELGPDGEIVGVISPAVAQLVAAQVASDRHAAGDLRTQSDSLGRFRLTVPGLSLIHI